MASVTRNNLQEVLGVDISANMDLSEFKQTLEEIDVNKISRQKEIVNTSINQSLQKINELEIMQTLMNNTYYSIIDKKNLLTNFKNDLFDSKNQYQRLVDTQLAVLGVAGGIQPPQPTMAAIIAPVSQAVTTLEEQVKQTEQQIITLEQENTKRAEVLKVESQNVVSNFIEKMSIFAQQIDVKPINIIR